jgi:hypothetical protein
MEPGVYKMSFDEYAAIDAINNSVLVRASKTMAHATVQKEDTAAMKFGRDFHCYIMERELFNDRYVFAPEGIKFNTKDGKAWKEAQGNKEIVSFEDQQTMAGMEKSLLSGEYETARNLIEKSQKEMSLIWRHKYYGELCKARADLMFNELGIIADIKTCTNSDPESWLRTGLNAGSQPHFQPAWYLEGCESITELKGQYNTFLWILMETNPPYGISVVQATPAPTGEPDMVLTAKSQIDDILPRYIAAKKSNHFEGRPDKIVHVSLPQYYLKGVSFA